jgi:hypothetical protein
MRKMTKEGELKAAFASLAADSLRGMSDDDFMIYMTGVVELLGACQAEFERRLAVSQGSFRTSRRCSPLGALSHE